MQNPGLGDSDHTCINFVLNCYAKVDRIKLPNYFKANYKTIRERLSVVNWISELDADFITGYVNFIRILELSMGGCIPDKSKRKEKNIYLTPEAIRKKNLKNKLWRRYIRTTGDYDRIRFNSVKNELRSLTIKLKLEFERRLAHNIKTSPL